MQYKIKNENYTFYIISGILFFLGFLFLMITGVTHIRIFLDCMILFFALSAVGLICAISYLLFRTTILVTDDTVTIKHLFLRRKILVKDIVSVNIDTIERYRRKPEPHHEFKKKMTISSLSGKKVVLYDDASEINGLTGFITGERDLRADCDIPLCQAYEQIMGLIRK